MRKSSFILFLLLTTQITYSQVGINTEDPQTTLDVNGDLQIRGEFRAGSSTNDEVAVGKAGQYLMSQGPGLPPTWGDMEIPELNTGDYVLRDTQFAEDRQGLALTTLSSSPITDGSTLDSQWSILEGLTTYITVSKEKNRVMFTSQTVVQSPYEGLLENDPSWATALCGIFIGEKGGDRSTFELVAVRQAYIKGAHYPQLGFMMISSYDDLPIGEHEVVVAYQRREGSDTLNALPLHIGQGFDTGKSVQVSNNFMNKSVIRVDVFEPESDNGGIGG